MGLGKALVATGVGLALLGLLIQLAPGLRLGRLPGDVNFGGSSWRVWFPLGTSLLLSVLLTLAFALFNLFARRH